LSGQAAEIQNAIPDENLLPNAVGTKITPLSDDAD
jgi:hypothetical protein